MSVRIKLDLLSDSQKSLIRKFLIFQPKKTNFFKKNTWYSDDGKEPIQFFYVDKPNNEVVLPY